MSVVAWLWIRLKRWQAHEPASDEVRGGGPDDSREGAPYLVRHGRLDGERIEGHLVKVERDGVGRGGASWNECSPGTTRTERCVMCSREEERGREIKMWWYLSG